MKRRCDVIVTAEQRNNHITGTTSRITTNQCGFIGIDFVERVKFDMNTCGTVRIDIEGRKYIAKGIKKRDLSAFIRCFCTVSDNEIKQYQA